MRKLIVLLLLFSFGYGNAQSPDFNMQKYWYLRWRLKNYFMVVGPNYGEGYPFGVRGWMGDNLQPGDIPNYLATYMGVLATEIKILKSKGIDYTETKRELYYALYALNRLDDCEGQYPWGGFDSEYYADIAYPSSEIGDYVPNPANLNGACLRLDAPNDFVYKHYDQLHKNISENFTNGNFGDPMIFPNKAPTLGLYNQGLNVQFYPNSTAETYGWPTLDLMKYKNDRNDDGTITADLNHQIWNSALENIRSFSMLSQDHISSLYMGLALVVKSLDEDESYDGLAFQDGTTGFVAEARNITTRLRSYMRSTNYNLRLINGDEIIEDWGGDAWALAFGFGQAAKFILDHPNYDNSTSFSEESRMPLWGPSFMSTNGNSSTAWIVCKLFATNNHNGDLLFSHHSDNNQSILYSMCYNNDWQAYYPLINSYLHDVVPLTTIAAIEQDLNLMPCSGNYHLGPNFPTDWATSHKYHDNTADNNGQGGFEGVYTGLEYMLMMNLTVLKFPNMQYDFIYNNFSGNIEEEYPHVTVTETIGANSISGLDYNIHPAVVYSIEPLNVSTNIKNGVKTISKFNPGFPPTFSMQDVYLNANVTFRSVGSVTIDALNMDPGSYFKIENNPYECNEDGTAYEYVPNTVINQHNLKNDLQVDQLSNSLLMLNNQINGNIEVFPNPTNGLVEVNRKNNNISKIIVQNILGNIVFETNTILDNTLIDLRNFNTGLYFIVCITVNENKTFKILKN